MASSRAHSFETFPIFWIGEPMIWSLIIIFFLVTHRFFEFRRSASSFCLCSNSWRSFFLCASKVFVLGWIIPPSSISCTSISSDICCYPLPTAEVNVAGPFSTVLVSELSSPTPLDARLMAIFLISKFGLSTGKRNVGDSPTPNRELSLEVLFRSWVYLRGTMVTMKSLLVHLPDLVWS